MVWGERLTGTASRIESTQFEVLYRQTFRAVYAYCRRRCMSDADAEDAVAEIYATAWRRFDQFSTARTPEAWLYGVGYRVLANKRRSAGRSERLVAKVQGHAWADAASPSETTVARLELAKVTAELDNLDELDQEIIRLSAYEDLSYKEIAVVLDLRVSAVRTRLYRARKQLADVTRDERELSDTIDREVVVDLRADHLDPSDESERT